MRWTAHRFWRDRQDMVPIHAFTTDDVLRTAFLAGATEAEAEAMGEGVVRVAVAGCSWIARRRIKRELEDEAPIGTLVNVEKIKESDDG